MSSWIHLSAFLLLVYLVHRCGEVGRDMVVNFVNTNYPTDDVIAGDCRFRMVITSQHVCQVSTIINYYCFSVVKKIVNLQAFNFSSIMNKNCIAMFFKGKIASSFPFALTLITSSSTHLFAKLQYLLLTMFTNFLCYLFFAQQTTIYLCNNVII